LIVPERGMRRAAAFAATRSAQVRASFFAGRGLWARV
jgi:hypothetical protein